MVVDSDNAVISEIETVNVDQGDGSSFIVHLDPKIAPARRFFDDIDHLYHFVDSIDASGQVSLNKNLYLQLKHALFPSEIAALDMEGIAIVGEYKYVISEETISRIDTTQSDATLEIKTYHGKSGEAYLDEFVTLARNINDIDALKDLTFHDPDIKSLYADIKNTMSTNKIANPDRMYYDTGKENQFPFDNPTTGQYYYSSPSGIHDRGYHLWNQSIGRFSRRALAYTALSFRPTNTQRWYPYNYGSYGKCLGDYTTTNFVVAIADGGKGQVTCNGTYECRARALRGRKTGSVSWHSAGYKAPDIVDPPYYREELPTSFVLTVYDMKRQKVD